MPKRLNPSDKNGANPFSSDDWDWPYILYVGRVWLHYTDEEIMNMTPRKFKSQLDVHYDVQQRLHGGNPQRNSTDQVGYIDQIPGW